jgi:hypothetical protein
MTKYTSNRQRNLKVGITSYTENLTVLEVTGGAYISSSVGIGTTVPSQSLHVQGNARISGAVYDSTNVPGSLGQVLQSTATGTVWANSSVVGVPSYSDRAGIATYANIAGIATYADRAGIATNVIGGIASVTSLSVSGITTLGVVTAVTSINFASGGLLGDPYGDGGFGLKSSATGSQYSIITSNNLQQFLQVDDNQIFITTGYASTTGTYDWQFKKDGSTEFPGNVGIATANPTSKLTVQGDVLISGVVTATTFIGNLTGTASNATYATNAGIATYATNAGIATYATNAGIATYADRAGIATYATNAGIATYADISGIATYATNAGIATYADRAGISTNVIGGIASVTSLLVSGISTLGTVKVSSGIISATTGIVTYYGDGSGLINIQASAIVGGTGYVDFAGVSTNVIGGIASVRSLSVSGISTLGTVLVSSGIVSATSGIVTYYGDGSNLTGIQTSGVVSVINQDPTVSSPVYPTLVNAVGISSLNISTTKLSFIPSSNKLGIGTGLPRENLDVVGTIGIQSAGSSNRFYLQHNPSQSSIDFIFV